MLISLIMQIAQSMQISIRHFLNPQIMHITFPIKNLAVKNISGLTHCRYSSGKWTNNNTIFSKRIAHISGLKYIRVAKKFFKKKYIRN